MFEDCMDTKVVRNVVVFIIAVILSGRIGVLVDSVLSEQPEGDSLRMGIWLVLPMLTAIAITIFSKGNWNNIGFKLNFKGNMKWYLIAALIFSRCNNNRSDNRSYNKVD